MRVSANGLEDGLSKCFEDLILSFVVDCDVVFTPIVESLQVCGDISRPIIVDIGILVRPPDGLHRI